MARMAAAASAGASSSRRSRAVSGLTSGWGAAGAGTGVGLVGLAAQGVESPVEGAGSVHVQHKDIAGSLPLCALAAGLLLALDLLPLPVGIERAELHEVSAISLRFLAQEKVHVTEAGDIGL